VEKNKENEARSVEYSAGQEERPTEKGPEEQK